MTCTLNENVSDISLLMYYTREIAIVIEPRSRWHAGETLDTSEGCILIISQYDASTRKVLGLVETNLNRN